ncbi:MAG: hypothetical protein ACP5IL_03680 [Syntrophobacteraceae bacterium]
MSNSDSSWGKWCGVWPEMDSEIEEGCLPADQMPMLIAIALK